ncbi:hypothetical protein PR048_003587 [Dryococelus australis]|uniref:Uncharacterized protein n=1 Tax=Dryococelus australis TaxID=614101 RepID=A0ABQ9INI6_9NEOP|nr:hypothetical protein PR048_003587 [Dryococelus australis]
MLEHRLPALANGDHSSTNVGTLQISKMGRNRVPAQERAEQYKIHGLRATDGNTIFCKFCNCSVSWGKKKKDSIEKHASSMKHVLKKKNSVDQRIQTSLVSVANSTTRRKLDSDYLKKKTVEAFAKARWINEFTHSGCDVACVKTLREKYVPVLAIPIYNNQRSIVSCFSKIATEYVSSTIAALEGKTIHMLCDETTDRVGNCVFVVIFYALECSEEKLFVASVTYLDACNATSCSRAVLDAIEKYNISYDRILRFVSDGARYMTLCSETLKVVVGDHLLRVQCWAHKLNLLGNSWTLEMNELDKVITAVNYAFLNPRKRKIRYLNYLEEKHTGKKPAKLFPAPVLTRRNSWFNAFFKLPGLLEICNSGINHLSRLTNKQVGSLHAQAIFVKEHAQDLVQLATSLEGSKYMTSHHLYPNLDTLSAATEEVEQGKLLPKTRAALSELNDMEKASAENIFRKAACSARYKLTELKTADPGEIHFQRIAKAFSPTMIVFKSDEEEAGLKNLSGFSELPQTDISRRYKEMKRLAELRIKKKLKKLKWKEYLHAASAEYPEFVKCCSRLLWTPTNNVDSERLLSHYNNAVADRRTKLKESNAELFTALSFRCSDAVVTHRTRVREETGFGSRSGHPDFGFPLFSEIPPGECLDESLTKAMTHSCPFLLQSLFPVQLAPSLTTSLSTRPWYECNHPATGTQGGIALCCGVLYALHEAGLGGLKRVSPLAAHSRIWRADTRPT